MISLNLDSVSVRRLDELVMFLANGRNLTKTDLSKKRIYWFIYLKFPEIIIRIYIRDR